VEETPITEETPISELEIEPQIVELEPKHVQSPIQISIIPTPEPSKEKETPITDFMLEIKDDLFNANFGNTLNFQLHKRPSREHISNPLKEESFRKPPYLHVGHREEFEDGMSSELVEGEPSHLEAIPILSSSMPTFDVLSEPISKPILDPDDPSYILSPKSHDDPRNPLLAVLNSYFHPPTLHKIHTNKHQNLVNRVLH
jgi:hypothetical protein